jgi:hypothetical protein
MDPLSVGLSIAGIIGIIGKSVTSLNDLRIQCGYAELKLELLARQLETVRTAFHQVEEFVSDLLPSETQHVQLIIDLSKTIGTAKFIVEHLNHRLTILWTPGSAPTLEQRIRLVVDDKPIEEHRRALQELISALQLCLTAFQWLV